MNLNWPTAFALVFGGLPLVVFGTAVLVVYPGIALPLLGIAWATWGYRTRQARQDVLAARCAAEYPFAAALVANADRSIRIGLSAWKPIHEDLGLLAGETDADKEDGS